MKICIIICEFNPFHNGHAYLIERARQLTECDRLVCIMSGCFTQHGDICITDKYIRAKHAVLAGADCVIELPVAFSVAPAEIFASGAVKILSSVPSAVYIAFGCENDDKEAFISAAHILLEENENLKKALKINLSNGESYAKSYAAAFESAGGKRGFLTGPNNILATEYTKAILKQQSALKIVPVKRTGAQFDDCNLKENFSSAGAIRRNISSPLIKNNVPEFVFNDLKDFSEEEKLYGNILRLVLARTPENCLSQIYGCGEGLENKLKKSVNLTASCDELISETTSRRYPSARIKRILCANFLRIYQKDCESYLASPLYIKPLAVRKSCADEIFSELAKSPFPVITGGSGKLGLNGTASKCFETDEFAYAQWRLICGKTASEKVLII